MKFGRKFGQIWSENRMFSSPPHPLFEEFDDERNRKGCNNSDQESKGH